MKLSKKWLAEYCKLSVTDKAFADAMTMSGSKVEGFESEMAELANIVVGQIVAIERHADSDHLWVCQVDVGGEAPIQIVTGAQNLTAGDIVPAALDKSVVAGGKKIQKGKLRGVESAGMLCSLEELGLTTHDFPYAAEDGIFVLGEDCERTLGMDIRSTIGLNDVVTEFEITPNRPDCLSVLGLAREAAATFETGFAPPAVSARPVGGEVDSLLRVNIAQADKCYRYAGAVVQNVRVAPSPRWLRERLRASGVRPINNIVDITNYVMLEYGQPMHAFDLRYLDGGTVNVRHAAPGESITTLDGTERSLQPDMLVIADANKPVAVAGVMGGEYSGIMEDTTTIVFESACFNGVSVRVTAKKLGMRTESSGRFEKGLDAQGCALCLNRALDLIEQLDAGDVVPGIVDCYPADYTPVTLPFEPQWVNRFIGIDVPAETQKAILEKLEFTVENDIVTVPSFRADVEHAADLSEEVARFYGFENIENRPLAGVADARYSTHQLLERRVTQTLLACGLSEIATYSFISPKAYDKILLPADSKLRDCVTIQNPLGEDTGVMRTTALPSMLEVLARNYNNRNKEAALFELATVYRSNGTEELPCETQKIMLGMYGEDCDFYRLKGVVETLLNAVGLRDYELAAKTDDAAFHPGRCAAVLADGKELALLGEVSPAAAENYGFGTRAYAASIALDALLHAFAQPTVYKPLPKYPAMARDLAFVCPKELTVQQLQKVIAKSMGKLLEHIALFDIYEGAQIPNGMKSVAFALRLRSAERTLTDEETDNAIAKALKALREMGIELRG